MDKALCIGNGFAVVSVMRDGWMRVGDDESILMGWQGHAQGGWKAGPPKKGIVYPRQWWVGLGEEGGGGEYWWADIGQNNDPAQLLWLEWWLKKSTWMHHMRIYPCCWSWYSSQLICQAVQYLQLPSCTLPPGLLSGRDGPFLYLLTSLWWIPCAKAPSHIP
jgi:hypothetical protein